MCVVSWKINQYVLLGTLCLFANLALAVPLQQEDFVGFSSGSDRILNSALTAKERKSRLETGFNGLFETDKRFYNESDNQKLKSNHELIIPDGINSGVSDSELESLQNTIYFEDRNKRDRREFYSSQNNEQAQKATVNLLDEKESDLSLLLETMNDNPELKEEALNALDSVKNIKELLTINSEITYKNSEEESQQLIERNLAQQKQQMMLDQKGINNTISKKKYDSSIFREFFSKVLNFVFYAVAGIVLMKLIFSFVSWQRKVNKF